MDEDAPSNGGWFEGLERGDEAALAAAVRDGRAGAPADWPAQAVAAGFADSESGYYDTLHEVTLHATREAVHEAERAGDRQLVHAVRAMDDCARTANELAERVEEWAGSLLDESGSGVAFAREVAEREDVPTALRTLAERVRDLDEQAATLRTDIERTAPDVAPNLAAMAGPILAARLISLGGGLESLAKKPSGTLQVLGAEEALFAHLRGHAPSPKHGVIYTHDAIRNTHPDDRGSASRALAGKLTIAARVDHYSGERKPELDEELRERIETIRARKADADGNAGSSAENGDADDE